MRDSDPDAIPTAIGVRRRERLLNRSLDLLAIHARGGLNTRPEPTVRGKLPRRNNLIKDNKGNSFINKTGLTPLINGG